MRRGPHLPILLIYIGIPEYYAGLTHAKRDTADCAILVTI